MHGISRSLRLAVTLAVMTLAVTLTATLMTACSTTNHDVSSNGTLAVDVVLNWWRVDTPPSVTTEYFACWGTDGILVDQQDGSAVVTPHDTMCPANGASYRIEYAVGSNPKILVWKGQIPPDDIPPNILAPYSTSRR